MSLQDYQYFMIMNLEATCCDQNTIPRTHMEIIEIGAVMLKRDLSLIDEFQTFIQPVRFPTLTNFCKQLTTITQEELDYAPDFKEAIDNFYQWLQHYPNFLFCSWGDYDRKQMMQDCQFHQIDNPFNILNANHLNIKVQFAERQGLNKPLGLSDALNKVRLSLNGTHHRGIDDAKNMARLMPWIVGNELLLS